MFNFQNSFDGFLSSLFGFLNSLLTGVFGFLGDFFAGLNIG